MSSSRITPKELSKLLQNDLDKDKDRVSQKIRDPFPKLGQHACICAQTQGGKSFLIKYMLADVYAGAFDQIYVFCPTGDKENYDVFDIPKENIILKFDQESLIELFTQIKEEFIKRKGKLHTLWIFDDCCNILRGIGPRGTVFNDILATARHHSITIWLAEQYIKFLTPGMRSNCISFFIFPNLSPEFLETLGESTMGKKVLKSSIDAVREENAESGNKYGCLYWNRTCFNERFYLNISEDGIEIFPIAYEDSQPTRKMEYEEEE